MKKLKLILLTLCLLMVFGGCANKEHDHAPPKNEKFSDQYLVLIESWDGTQTLIDIKAILGIAIDQKTDRCTVFQAPRAQVNVARCSEFLVIIKDTIGYR